MNVQRLAAIVLIVVGALGVAYGGFSYTSETHHADLGPIHMSVAEKERVNIPMWAGVGALVLGGFLLLARRKVL
jgi:LPXTG-motif cell wall-anchored protein